MSEDAGRPWVDGLTIGQTLRQTARRQAERDAVVFPQLGVRWSYAEFDRIVDDAARGLLQLGLQRGDHFGVWATNVPQWVVAQFATARIGVVLVTINPAYRPQELAYALRQSEVRGLALIDRFKTTNYFASLEQVCPAVAQSSPGELQSDEFPKLQWIVRLRGPDHVGMLPWDEMVLRGRDVPPEALEKRESEADPNDPINLQYTSGTTGSPKGAVLTHRNLLLNAHYAADFQQLAAADRICIPVPLYHCFGCVLGTLCAVTCGAAMVFPNESFDAGLTLDAIAQESCTALYGVPTMFIAELEDADFAACDTSSLRTGIMAGSPCPIELMKRVTHEMGCGEITIGYGQTEASPLITQTRTNDPLALRVGTVGRALPDIEVKIVDPNTGKTLPADTTGELCCRGHNVMLGYYRDAERTAQAIDADGWLHTGDLALQQADGYFRITGRLKDMIIRGGENISPRELEELLYAHPKVESAQVVGVPSRKYGEEVLACVKLRRGEEASEEEIRDYCLHHLARFKAPRYVKFVDSFPTTVTGKVQKFKIREQAVAELGLEGDAAVETA